MRQFGSLSTFGALTACLASGLSASAQLYELGTERMRVRLQHQSGEWVGTTENVAGREGPAIAWDRTTFPAGGAFFINAPVGDLWADWGDVATGTVVNGIDCTYFMRRGQQAQFLLGITEDDNGGPIGGADPNDPNTDPNTPGTRELVYGVVITFTIPNVPQNPAAAHVEFLVDLNNADPNDPVDDPFTLSGPDLDADGRTDFGYAYGTQIRGAGTTGPSLHLAGPDPIGSPGAEDVVTFFSATDPNTDPTIGWYFGWPDPNAAAGFVASGAFQVPLTNPSLFAQFALRLYTDGECVDPDGDGICTSSDICPNVADPNQTDSDSDGHGDACDLCPGNALGDNGDNDGDTVGNPCDNCPDNANLNQADCDNDGIGDACDPDGPCTTTCPNPGCDDGGIDADFNDDCIVNLTDLATQLANFGTDNGPGGAVVPNALGNTNGDSNVNLTDLANLLARFGTDCN